MLDFLDGSNELENDSTLPMFVLSPEEKDETTRQKNSGSSVFACITNEAVLIAVGIIVAKTILWYFYQAAESEGIDVSFL